MQVDPAAQLLQQRQVYRRDGRQAEDMRTGGHAGLGGQHCARRQHGAQRVEQAGYIGRGRQLGRQPPPQRGLPGVVDGGRARRQGQPVVRPGRQPLGLIGVVLVEQAGRALGQVEAGHCFGLGDVSAQARLGGHPGGSGFTSWALKGDPLSCPSAEVSSASSDSGRLAKWIVGMVGGQAAILGAAPTSAVAGKDRR